MINRATAVDFANGLDLLYLNITYFSEEISFAQTS